MSWGKILDLFVADEHQKYIAPELRADGVLDLGYSVCHPDFDLQSFVAFQHYASSGIRLDADTSAAFARQLEYIFTELYNVEYPDLKARQLFPVDNRIPTWAETYTYRTFDKKGSAEIINNYANDFPTTENLASERSQKVKSLGNSYIYTMQEMRAAAAIGQPLDTMKAETARESMERKLDYIAFLGDTPSGLYGVLNAPGVQGSGTSVTDMSTGATVAADAAYTLNDWSLLGGATTPAMVADDVKKMASGIFTKTKGVHRPSALVLDSGSFSLLENTARSPIYTNDSVLQFILSVNTMIKAIDWSSRLDNADGLLGGTSGKPRIFCYERAPRIASLMMAQEFEQFAPQPRNMAFMVPCHMRTGGMQVRYPQAFAVGKGVAG